MARLKLRVNPQYGFISSGDKFTIPEAIFGTLRHTFGADWSKDIRELRLPLAAVPSATRWLEQAGHEVVQERESGRRGNPRGPRECRRCGHPYASDVDPAGRKCVECGDDLDLIAPHVCDGCLGEGRRVDL